jgi:primosomal replication protein N
MGGTGSTAPNAGRLVVNAVVIAISPEGIPIIDFVSEVSSSGHVNKDIAAARCATFGVAPHEARARARSLRAGSAES